MRAATSLLVAAVLAIGAPASADARWTASAAERVTVGGDDPPVLDTCAPPYSVEVRLLRTGRGARSKVEVRLTSRATGPRYSGWMRISTTAPGGLEKRLRLEFRRTWRITTSGPVLRRPGLYRVRATVHADGCPVSSDQVKVRVTKKRR